VQFWGRHFFSVNVKMLVGLFQAHQLAKKKFSSLFSRCKPRKIFNCTVKLNYKHISSSYLERFNDNYFIYLPSVCAEALTTGQLNDTKSLCCVSWLTAAEHGYLSIRNNWNVEAHSWKFVTLASRTIKSMQLRIDLRQLKWVTKIRAFSNRNFHPSSPL
jgi:hypothetical protein